MTEKEIADFIMRGGHYTLCEPQRVTRKMRIRNIGKKTVSSSRKGRAVTIGNEPRIAMSIK